MTINTDEFSLMSGYIEELCGIRVSEDKAYLIENRLGLLVRESGCSSFKDFYLKLKNSWNPDIRRKIIDMITTNETFWFRDSYPFTVLKEKIIPEYLNEIRSGKREKVRIWSAASSKGQEPYSIAMTILDAIFAQSGINVNMFEIFATDISGVALNAAIKGEYDQLAMSRGLPPILLSRYFKEKGKYWKISDKVKKIVIFKSFNLQDSFGLFNRFDIIFCRNVAIYFSDDFKRKLFDKLAASLNKSGLLFLGASESISAYSARFEMIGHGKGVYYRVR